MRSTLLKISSVLGLLLGVPACSPVDPQPGQLGGPCRASLTPCDPGLVCNGTGCAEPTGESDANYGVTFAFKDNKTAVQADGVDTTIITARFFEAINGLSQPAPENLQFRMWVDPPTAGTLEFNGTANPMVMGEDSRVPWRIIDPNGGATVRFTGCDKALTGCIKFATIRVAVQPDPLVPVANVAIENIGAGPAIAPQPDAEPGVEPGPDVPTPALPDGFGPTEKCVGRSNEMYLQGDDTAQVFRGEGTYAISDWRLNAAIRVASADGLDLDVVSDELMTTVTFRINVTPTGEDLMVGEYDNATSTSDPMEGSAQFSFLLANGMLGTTCSRSSPRRFAVQELRIEESKIEKLTMSFVHACDGGIIQGCFSIQQIP